MRIIAGTLGGRLFDSPHGHRTHPMSDKIRGALFNMLGDIEGLTVLDAFAGTGALAFEAVSRGAKHATAIESDKAAQNTIARNIHNLGVSHEVSLVRATANAWLQTYSGPKFDLVLLDPPYDNLQINVVGLLAKLVSENGIVVLSWPGNGDLPAFENCELMRSKRYGDAQLAYYKNTGNATKLR